MDSQKLETIRYILTDRLDHAEKILPKHSGLAELKKLIKSTPRKHPLKAWHSPLPKFITTSVSYTCGIGCEMCNAGFAGATFLFEDYKYLTPKEFDALQPWIKSATHVALVGLGETLDSPHLELFLKKLENKITFISTSGVPLNKKIIKKLIHSKLHYLNLSFDGRTTAGHGGGKDNYARKFWKKIELIQKTKQGFEVSHPILHLTIAVDSENTNQLDEIIKHAKSHGIPAVDLIYMVPHNSSLYEKSIFKDLAKYRIKINSIMRKWNLLGVNVRFFEKKKLDTSPKICYFIDKHIMFNLDREKPDLCCGSLDMPLKIGSLTPKEYWNSFPFRYLRFLHFSGEHANLPAACEKCWVLHPEKTGDYFKNSRNSEDEYLSWYHKAGRMKSENKNEEAEALYLRVVRASSNPKLIGKAWFHLGECSLMNGLKEEAFQCMRKSVQFCFDHTLAFAYLALLIRHINFHEKPGSNQKPDCRFIDSFKPAISPEIKELAIY